MSKKISCTLTSAQWSHLLSAVDMYELHIEDEMSSGHATQRERDCVERMFDKLQFGDKKTASGGFKFVSMSQAEKEGLVEWCKEVR